MADTARPAAERQGLGLGVHTAHVVGDLGRLWERLVQRELDRERAR